jgi:uncharacterized protein YegL
VQQGDVLMEPEKKMTPILWKQAAILLICLVFLVGSVLPTTGQTSGPEINDLDIVLVIDQSGSMWRWNDPENSLNSGWRLVMTKLFADLLGVDQTGADHRLSIIFFGTGNVSRVIMPLSNMRDLNVRDQLNRDLDSSHTNMGRTDIPKALQLAKLELENNGRGGNTKGAIIFLSDGECEITTNETQESKAACNREIRRFVNDNFKGRYPVYTIAFTEEANRKDPNLEVYKNLWQEMALTTSGLYFEPNKADRDLLDVYLKIMRHLYGLPSANVPPPIQSPSDTGYEIPPNLLQVVFTTVKFSKDIQTTIIRPDGRVLSLDDPDVLYQSSGDTESFSILTPDPGTWTVRLRGDGMVNVIFIEWEKTGYRVMKRSPGASHPQGKPMEINVRLVDQTNEYQSVDELNLEVQYPDGRKQQLPVTHIDGVDYLAQLMDTSQRGQYVLRFTSSQENGNVNHDEQVTVVPVDWIQIVEPSAGGLYPVNLPLTVEAQLMFGNEPVTKPDLTDRYTITVQVIDSSGSPVDTQQLQLDTGGVFKRQFKLSQEGDYEIIADMAVSKANGEMFQDKTYAQARLGPPKLLEPSPTSTFTSTAAPSPTITFTPQPPTHTPTPTPVPPPPSPPSVGTILGVFVTLGLLGGGTAVGYIMYNRPSLSGMIHGGDGGLVPLSGKKPVLIGSDPRCGIPVNDLSVLGKHAEIRASGDRKSARVEIRSLNSDHPIEVNGMPTNYQTLQDGDIIKVGDQSFKYEGLSTFHFEDFQTNLDNDTLS